MKNVGFIMLALVMSAGVMAGCTEKKQSAEKAGEATVQAEKAVVETPVEAVEGAPAVIAAPEEKVAEKAEAKIVEKAVEVKKEAAVVVEKVEEKVAASTAAVEMAVEKSSAAAYDAEAGAAIFKSKCAPCHGAMGKGTPMAPALAGNEWIRSAADADIAGVIKNGRDGAAKRYPKFPIGMPSNKGMAEGDLGALVGYLRSIN